MSNKSKFGNTQEMKESLHTVYSHSEEFKTKPEQLLN